MKAAVGHYINIFEDSRLYIDKKDIFIIFNEPNPKPTPEEVEMIQTEVEAILENKGNYEPYELNRLICETVESMACECVSYGVQVIISCQKGIR